MPVLRRAYQYFALVYIRACHNINVRDHRGGSATQQNRVRDYVIFAILPRLHQGLHMFVIHI